MWNALFSAAGRSSRAEFLALGLPLPLCALVLVQILRVLGPIAYGHTLAWDVVRAGLIALALAALLAVVAAAFALCARRLHDVGQSGLWSLLLLVPGPAPLVLLLVLALAPGQAQANRYGLPRGAATESPSTADA